VFKDEGGRIKDGSAAITAGFHLDPSAALRKAHPAPYPIFILEIQAA
jgi:hypothetical protein